MTAQDLFLGLLSMAAVLISLSLVLWAIVQSGLLEYVRSWRYDAKDNRTPEVHALWMDDIKRALDVAEGRVALYREVAEKLAPKAIKPPSDPMDLTPARRSAIEKQLVAEGVRI